MKIHIIGGPGSGKTFLAELYYKNKKTCMEMVEMQSKRTAELDVSAVLNRYS